MAFQDNNADTDNQVLQLVYDPFFSEQIQVIFDFNVGAQCNATLGPLWTSIILNWAPQWLVLAQSPGMEVAPNLDDICKQYLHIQTNEKGTEHEEDDR